MLKAELRAAQAGALNQYNSLGTALCRPLAAVILAFSLQPSAFPRAQPAMPPMVPAIRKPVAAALQWTPSTSAGVTGYNIYRGTQSREYTNEVAVGNVTNATMSGLAPGVTFYFAATAADSLGLESDYSNEVVFNAPQTNVVTVACGAWSLSLTNAAGAQFWRRAGLAVQASPDLVTWTTVTNLPAPAALTISERKL